jgi:NAD(P)-dependent dehydrogenase (short-subunit alcohol dehydrogenase family)
VSDHDAVLITGASGRIGRVLVHAFLNAGVQVAAVSRSEQAERASDAAGVLWITADLLATDGMAAVTTALETRGMFPRAIIHAARRLDDAKVPGGAQPSMAQWSLEFNTAVVCAHDLVMHIARNRGERLASVVLLSSMYGLVAANPQLYEGDEASPVHYGVVRAAVIQLARELAIRLAPRVRVNALSFGGVKGRASADFEQRYARLCPAGRMLDDPDIFGPVEFLTSRASSGMTGQNLIVDGGWTAW